MKHINKTGAKIIALVALTAACVSARAQLNGTYTVYGAGANYADLQTAANALSAGVSGPVTFRIRPGNWSDASTSDAIIGNVSGASATNTITFEAENGDAATTTITNTNTSSSTTPSGGDGNFIFYLNGAKYIRVRNLTLNKTDNTYGNAVRFVGDADNNIIENCVLTGSSSTTTNTGKSRIYGTSLTDANNNIIRNNTINYGSRGIFWEGNSSSSLSEDNEFSGNTFVSPYNYGIYTYYTENLKMLKNTITRTGGGTFYGFYAYYADGAYNIDSNKYTGTAITGSNYPLNIYYCDGTSTSRGSITGNEIDVTSSTAVYNNIYYGNYYSLTGNKITIDNKSTCYALRNYTGSSSYGKEVYVNENEITAKSTSTIYVYGHYSYSDKAQFNKNKIDLTTTGTVYIYGGYQYMTGGAQMNDNTINVKGGSGSFYLYGVYYYSDGGNQFNGNDITVSTTSGYIYNRCGYLSSINTNNAMNQYNNNKMDLQSSTSGYVYNYMGYYDNSAEILDNDIYCFTKDGYYAYGIYTYPYNSTGDWNVSNNKVTAVNDNYYYAYGIYMSAYYSTGKFTISNNEINAINNKYYYAYGLYAYPYGGSSTWTIANNKIVAKSAYLYGGAYGIYAYQVGYGSVIKNNAVSVFQTGSSGSAYGIYVPYCKGGGTELVNNSIYSKCSYSNYAVYGYQSAAGEALSMRNNVIRRVGGSYGATVQCYHPSYHDFDYNNYGASTSPLVSFANLGLNHNNINAIRSSGLDKNSLSYNPGFVDEANGDLSPDPANPNSWSLNGRGVQIGGNDKDINGNARAVTTSQGVPDLGAYEFTPTSTPPNCTLTPNFPTPNQAQYALFGGDTVAVFHWKNFTPSGFAVKQYTGTEAPNILSINTTKMFYHIDVQGTGSTLAYDMDMYYKDPWLGTIASKAALRLAEKVGSSNWSGYTPAVSTSNIVRNFIHTVGVNDVGALFTGIDIGNNASADAIVQPAAPFCPGTYAVKLRVKNNGNNDLTNVKIAWEINSGATNTYTHSSTIPIGGEALISLGNVTFGNAGVHIKAWTYDPNGVLDPIALDDTLDKTYFAALNGVYTVGGVSPDFPDVVTAAKALTDYGTCGNVVFNIRPGTYAGKVTLTNPVRLSSPNDRVTFQAENGNAAGVKIEYVNSGSGDAVIMMNGDNYTLRNLTVNALGASYATPIAIYNASSNDSILGCNISMNATITYQENSGIFAHNTSTSFKGSDIVIKGNKINVAYAAICLYGSSADYMSGIVIDSNELSGYMGTYIFYSSGLKITNNKMTGFKSSSYYGVYNYYAYDGPEISNNRVAGYYGYGMYAYLFQGSSAKRAKVVNNSVVMDPSKSGQSAFTTSSIVETDIVNNTFIYNGSSYTYSYGVNISSGTGKNNKVLNNVIANFSTSSNYGSYVYYNTGYNFQMDYNNLYSGGTNFMSGSATAKDLDAWRTGSKLDSHSVSYEPIITSATNAAPDVSNPAVWALNGHGVHIPGNNKDINGNPRPENRADGVPDIGAYEVTPDVAPPTAIATPASAAPGDEQVFTFAGNEVARVKWGNKAPVVPLEVRQYSGEKGTGIAAAAAPAGTMYFHTDIKPISTGTTFDYTLNIDYMDIWLGDIANKNDLRLAHKANPYPWMVYSGSLSSNNATTNNIDAADMNRFGSFSALENNSVASAFVRASGTTIICIGNSVQLNAEPNNGDNYEWLRNGVPVAGASGPNAKNYTATQAGDYSVAITFGSKVVESVPVTVSTIAPPNAVVGANKQLTYCAGNGLQLNAGNTQGLTYQWQLNGVDIAGATGSTHDVGQAGNYTVVVSNIGCSTVSAVTPVTAGPLTVSLGNDTSYCEVKNVFMKLDAGYPGASYKWNTGATTQKIEVKQAGQYWVEVNGGPNCISTDTINVTIDQLPQANGISYVQNGNSYQFFASGPIGVSGYMWLFSDGTTSSSPTPTKTITGDVYVRLVMFNACGTDTVQLGWPLTVSSIGDETSLQVYPNPAKDKVTISLEGGSNLEIVEVLNSLGAVVYRGEVSGSMHSVDVSGLANGHYMLRATTPDGTLTRQFDVLK